MIDAIEVFTNKIALKSVKSQGLELHLNRAKDGSLNLTNLVAASTPVKTDAAEAKKEESKPLAYSVGEIDLESAMIYIDDEGPQHPYKTRLDNVNFKVTGLTNQTARRPTSSLFRIRQ